MENTQKVSTFKYALGPGLILAAAAIGVSHLVQSTRAGAGYGFTLIWAVLLANLFKYPFLEYGPRYAIATKNSMIAGYKKLGNWALWLFVIFTVGTMFIIHGAVTIVTASLAVELTGINASLLVWSAIVLAVCIALLFKGQYSALDTSIKIIMAVLTVSTLAAIITAFGQTSVSEMAEAPSIWDVAGVSFLIALMGWMPIPIDGAAWHSLWSLERIKQTKHEPSMKNCLLDFNIGYIGAAVLAIAFLSLGALVMFGSGVVFSSSGAGFAKQLVGLYTQSLGEWAYWIIIICAFTTMFSTTLTVTDAYPRVTREILAVVRDREIPDSGILSYKSFLILISLASLLLLYFTGSRFTFMVDLATTLSFLTAPALAFINYRLVMHEHFPDEHRPPLWLRLLSWGGIIFMSGFALLYAYWQFSY